MGKEFKSISMSIAGAGFGRNHIFFEMSLARVFDIFNCCRLKNPVEVPCSFDQILEDDL